MHGLERILTHYFGVRIRGRSLVGQWLVLEPDQRTRLGVTGQNSVLGRDAVLGGRVWDQQGKFEVLVGPLTLAEFTGFLPGGDRLSQLVELTRFYVGPDFDFDVRLRLASSEVPASRLGAAVPPLLGWTSWLPRQDPTVDPEIHIRDPERVVSASTPAGPGESDLDWADELFGATPRSGGRSFATSDRS